MNKRIKHILLSGALASSLFATNSCQSDITTLNEDPKHPSVVPSSNLLATGLYQAFYYMYTGGVNFNNYRFFTQQWTETTYTDETNYNLITRAQPRNHFNRMYVYSLNSLNQAMKNLPAELNADADIANNKWATLEISSIFVWENIVDTYGDVPYTQALQAETIKSPKYDDAKSIYLDLIKRLDIAISKINTSKTSYDTADLIYKGNMSNWQKLANSIKLRLAMNLADLDPTTSKSLAEAAIAAGVIDSDASSFSLTFDGGTFSNPLFDDLVASGRNDFLPSSVIVNPMNTNSDPRRSAYFTPLANGTFKGGTFGSLNSYASNSHINPNFTKANAPAKLFSYAEIQFLKAEAAARGYNAGGDAATLFASALQASMAENGVSSADALAYIAAHPLDAANWKQSIGYESWIAMWNNPFSAWNFVRRLDYPVLQTPPNSQIGGVPYRMLYSDQEYVVNFNNVSAAAAAIGGDKATTKLFWDKF
ncbi:SusD/RagB family nutrient-binding outer membrane lipoprotein [uncultured Chryseobacterium sp.]|uniref:SusD/RagB family nutrient-binding outer membrane lipoprotein n=1 Tax=uncultured Chryseobacterium sp. TaxID=259322 RepID=UPI0025895D61|nr:SusD/RagB family nutrient-binding outer membrane lipoprotein [uncultured Chryseobacterium sp.]